MLKTNRPKRPDLDIYINKNQSITSKLRSDVLALIDPNTSPFGDLVPRLRDNSEKFTKAEKETLKAIQYYADPENFKDDIKVTKKKGPTFSVYKDKNLKKALRELFHKKCAYCDSSFVESSPADIEHFRPKAAINPFRNNKDESLIAPGYYWLAAEWTNLLWSCILCNRRNKLDLANEVGQRPLGKKNRFPLTNEARRIRSHNMDFSSESRSLLILDPCKHDPTKYLMYPLDDEDLGVVKARVSSQGRTIRRAESSLHIYGLNRTELVEARRKEALNFKGIFIGLIYTLSEFTRRRKAGENTDQIETHFRFLKDEFQRKLSPESQYLSLKRTLLIEFESFSALADIGLTVSELFQD